MNHFDGKEQESHEYLCEKMANDPRDKNRQCLDWTCRVGNGIDSSLMTLDGTQPASDFQADPQKYINRYVSATRPVFILDRSGHLAYVNRQAFVEAGICEKAETCGPKTAMGQLESPKEWRVGKDGLYTGLLLELPAYERFQNALRPYLPNPEKRGKPRTLCSWTRIHLHSRPTRSTRSGSCQPSWAVIGTIG